ncbi:Trypsin-like peptidase domain-containing protein [Celeribacter baekdonensis]|uniref:Trypsin-like peptidase domain-containing protein n=1 Tax=Celeribacter baekdonensis TaxID=875171 RepID=A0A1G7NVT2_9RHOB|nr:trypsin-like peptidase domain-containing protein [Celeribacter baekdonensis]SDF78081.1 Trypsin-like peptidase domain-containing protein [Celeribacter baekdonensis]
MAATAHFLTPSLTQLTLLAKEQEIGSGTGFFVKHGTQWFIVSNWHVFSGRNPRTGQPRHSSCAIPDECIAVKREMRDHRLVVIKHKLKLLDENENPLWLDHPEHGQNVDIAALKVNQNTVGIARNILSVDGHQEDMFVDLGGDLFIPGYPQGYSEQGSFPIWKKATLATSPEFDPLPINPLIVDTASREGMSGSPCLAICNDSYYRKVDGGPKMELIHKPICWKLLGVYSGRLTAKDALDTQLGRVWRTALIIDIISGCQCARPKLI